MINLMNENNLNELEVEKEGMRIKLKKSIAGEAPEAPLLIERSSPDKAKPGQQDQSPGVTTRQIEIKAPMVGTFYRAASPEAAPFVETGQIIDVGQVICIIEAMKLMNEIKSEIKGRLVEALAENAEPVEYGQSLFLIEPL